MQIRKKKMKTVIKKEKSEEPQIKCNSDASEKLLAAAAVAAYERAYDHAVRGGLRGAYPGESLLTPVLWMRCPVKGYIPDNVAVVPLAISLLAEFGCNAQEITAFVNSARQDNLVTPERLGIESLDGPGLPGTCPANLLVLAGFGLEDIVNFVKAWRNEGRQKGGSVAMHRSGTSQEQRRAPNGETQRWQISNRTKEKYNDK
jgi:hypothetical protein